MACRAAENEVAGLRRWRLRGNQAGNRQAPPRTFAV